jgi:2-C-methyl-D-erythritol 2,4-cyclodiphosphate synthase
LLRIKTGLGFDIHRLEEGKKLYLGGIEIPFSSGMVGHSDGDCLIHAVIDGLLGSAGMEDIGQMFPDSDPEYKDIRSTKLLEETMQRLKRKKIEIVNIDTVIIAEKPRLTPFISQMKKVLCPFLGIGEEDLGIKAKTAEGLGSIGEGQAMAAIAQVLVKMP